MNINDERRHPGQGDGANFETSCKSFLAVPRRIVNAILFHFRPLIGLLSCGFWAERICLWIIVLDQAAEMLRNVVGGRV